MAEMIISPICRDAAHESLEDADTQEESQVRDEAHEGDEDHVGENAALEKRLRTEPIRQTRPEGGADDGRGRGRPHDEARPAKRCRLIQRADDLDVERQEHVHEVDGEGQTELRRHENGDVPILRREDRGDGTHALTYPESSGNNPKEDVPTGSTE